MHRPPLSRCQNSALATLHNVQSFGRQNKSSDIDRASAAIDAACTCGIAIILTVVAIASRQRCALVRSNTKPTDSRQLMSARTFSLKRGDHLDYVSGFDRRVRNGLKIRPFWQPFRVSASIWFLPTLLALGEIGAHCPTRRCGAYLSALSADAHCQLL